VNLQDARCNNKDKHRFVCATHQRSTVSDIKEVVVSAAVLVKKKFSEAR